MIQPELIIFDADGTLRECLVPGQPCPNKPNEWRIIEGVSKHSCWHRSDRVAIASNQGGVGLGLLDERAAQQMLNDLFISLTGKRPQRWQVQMCPHAPRTGCSCRKPQPGMLLAAMRGAGIADPARVLYVGDMESDRQAAQEAGVRFQWASKFFS